MQLSLFVGVRGKPHMVYDMGILKGVAITLISAIGVVNTIGYSGLLSDKSSQVDSPDVSLSSEQVPSRTSDESEATVSPLITESVQQDRPDTTTDSASVTNDNITAPSSETDIVSGNEKFRILEIDELVGVDSQMYNFNRATAYNPTENILYYFTDSERTVYAYDVNADTTSVKITSDELKIAVFGEQEIGISNTQNNSKVSILGMMFNCYSNDVYIFGNYTVIEGNWQTESGRWFYSISKQEIVKGQSTMSANEQFFFVSDKEYLSSSVGGHSDIRDFNGNYNSSSLDYLNGYLFEHNEFFYYVSDSRISRIGSIYSPNVELVATLTGIRGASYHEGFLYALLDDDIVYKIDIDNNSRESYISSLDIIQTGRSFLGEGKLTGLVITNSGGFITYDASNTKLKYVAPN